MVFVIFCFLDDAVSSFFFAVALSVTSVYSLI